MSEHGRYPHVGQVFYVRLCVRGQHEGLNSVRDAIRIHARATNRQPGFGVPARVADVRHDCDANVGQHRNPDIGVAFAARENLYTA